MHGWRSRVVAFRPRLLATVNALHASFTFKEMFQRPQVFATFGKVQKQSDSLWTRRACMLPPVCYGQGALECGQGFFPAFRLRVGQLRSCLLASAKVPCVSQSLALCALLVLVIVHRVAVVQDSFKCSACGCSVRQTSPTASLAETLNCTECGLVML